MEKKELLKQNLIKHRNILNKSIYDYLDSLLELEFSALKEKISSNDKEVLRELNIYRQIAIYNINNRALKMIEDANLGVSLKKNNDSSIALENGKELVSLFSFHENEVDSHEEKLLLGTINLYRMVYDPKANKRILEETNRKLEELYKEAKSQSSYDKSFEFEDPFEDPMEECYDGIKVVDAYERSENITHYKNIIRSLENRKGLNEEERRIIKITSTIHRLLLEDYGLKEEDLIDEKEKRLKEIDGIENNSEKIYAQLSFAMDNHTSPYAIKPREDELILTKRLKDATIKSNIRYIL